MFYNSLSLLLYNVIEVNYMAYLDKKFNKFYDDICIHKEADDLRNKRDLLKADIEKYLPDKLDEIGIDINKSDFEFINQGSYAIGTTIINPYGAVDLDYGLVIPFYDLSNKDIIKSIKKAVKDSLSHVSTRTVNIKEPCITVSYYSNGDETVHIDFPVYAANENEQLFLARGKEFSSPDNCKWEDADPKGLKEYFNDYLSNNIKMRQIVRFVKKWKQEAYRNSTNDHEIPASVGLTILVCQNFVEKEHDILSLYETLKKIKDKFLISYDSEWNIESAIISCYLPKKPFTDVFYKMTDAHKLTFYNRICRAINNLNTAITLDDEHESGLYIQKVLGESFEIPEKIASNTAAKYTRESSFGKG